MTQEQFEALGIEKSLAKKAADESKKELEGYVAKETYDTTEQQRKQLETTVNDYKTHWNKSQRETEKAGKALFEAVRATRNATVNDETIKFILPVYDLQDIGVDDSGIYEMVIELAVIFEKKGNKDEE